MVWIDPYKAEARGIKYEHWRHAVEHGLDPYECESAGIPYEEWRKLQELAEEEEEELEDENNQA